LNNHVIFDESGSKINKLLIGVIQTENFKEMVKIIPIGYLGLLSKFATLNDIPFGEYLHIHAFLNIAFGVYLIAESQ